MSNFRQHRVDASDGDDGIEVRTFGVTFSARSPRPLIPPRNDGWHQLVYASRGAMTVRAASNDWLVIPHRALWIPSGVPYEIRLRGEVALRSLYFRRSRANPGLFPVCAALNITPLFRELVLRATLTGALSRRIPEQRNLIAVIRDELKSLTQVSLQLPVPSDRRAAQFADLIAAQLPAARPAMSRLFRRCGASQRTLERIFRSETAMSLGQWIRRHDLLVAVSHLAEGERVATVAEETGYNSSSAFIAMFRRELGESPARYLAARPAPLSR